MLSLNELGWFALAALVLVLTPGPNMIYCISRTLGQGRRAGLLSLCGVLLGFVAHLAAATLGLSALLLAVPVAFTAIKLAGAAYLLWLAWQAVRPGGGLFTPTLAAKAAALPPEGVSAPRGGPAPRSPFEPRPLPHDSPAQLFQMGLVTNLLNPKVAMFCLSLLPQFLHPERGSVLLQSIQLGLVQITVSGSVNAMLIFGAAGISAFLARSRGWLLAQRYLMGTMLAGLAVRVAMTERN